MNMRLKMSFAALLLTAGLASPVLGKTDTHEATTTQTAPPKHYRAHATGSVRPRATKYNLIGSPLYRESA